MADGAYKLKIKIGDHEFEAEGTPEDVREQFAMFKEMVSDSSKSAPAPSEAPPAADPITFKPIIPPAGAAAVDAGLAQIMNVEGRIVSLTAAPDTHDDSVLLIIYGQKVLRANDAATGSEILDGLEASGPAPNRIDRIIEKAIDAGDVMAHGSGRAKRYRLTNAGVAKARNIAAALLAKVA